MSFSNLLAPDGSSAAAAMILASSFGDVYMAELIGRGLIVVFLISLVSLLVAIPKSLRKYARWMSLGALLLSGAFFLFAGLQVARMRGLQSENAQVFGVLFGPTAVALTSFLLARGKL